MLVSGRFQGIKILTISLFQGMVNELWKQTFVRFLRSSSSYSVSIWNGKTLIWYSSKVARTLLLNSFSSWNRVKYLLKKKTRTQAWRISSHKFKKTFVVDVRIKVHPSYLVVYFVLNRFPNFISLSYLGNDRCWSKHVDSKINQCHRTTSWCYSSPS